MDKFIKKAEALISVWQELKSSSTEGAILFQTDRKMYQEAVLDTRILISEFGCQPLVDAIEQYRHFPNPTDCESILRKLIEAAELRNKKSC